MKICFVFLKPGLIIRHASRLFHRLSDRLIRQRPVRPNPMIFDLSKSKFLALHYTTVGEKRRSQDHPNGNGTVLNDMDALRNRISIYQGRVLL